MDLFNKDYKIEYYRPEPSVNMNDTGVKVTHIPTGITAQCGNLKGRRRNKEVALKECKHLVWKQYPNRSPRIIPNIPDIPMAPIKKRPVEDLTDLMNELEKRMESIAVRCDSIETYLEEIQNKISHLEREVSKEYN